jgi:tRNA(Ile)-lysidine synthetase-like protein
MEIIYSFWENNYNLWFNSTAEDDKYIYDNFNDFLSLKLSYIDAMSKKEWTSYCILNDQLRRHINRHININETNIINLEDYYVNYNKFKDNLTDFEFMFQLMPIRHTHQLIHVKFVLSQVWERLSKDLSNKQIRKYLVATYERYIKCSNEDNLSLNINNKLVFNNYEILDSISPNIFKNIDIIEHICPLYICMKEFINNLQFNLKDNRIILSISGGVDSMVCSYLLKMLKQDFIAVHIDYYNRDECNKEEELLIWWCNTILNIPLYIRRIDEINRPKCMEYELRELYETYTKNVRYNSYIIDKSIIDPLIMLGHNKDDTIENILTNTSSQSHFDNLLGMKPISYQNHTFNKTDYKLCFLRPLINIPKSDIYDFVITNHIPFLKDSTPKWSQRGKIRDIVKPALNEWNPLIFDGLIKVSEKMSQMTLLLEKLIDKLILTDIIINNIHEVPIEEIYWTIYLKKNNIFITQKTLNCLIEKIKFLQKNEYKLKEIQKFTLAKNIILSFKQNKDKLIIEINFIN